MGSSDPDPEQDQGPAPEQEQEQPSSVSELLALLSFFHTESAPAGRRLWRQGDPSDCALLLVSGSLRFELEDEAGTTETGQGSRSRCSPLLLQYLSIIIPNLFIT